MAKRSAPKQTEQRRKDWCRDCAYNEGIGVMGGMYHCSFLDYCVVVNLGYCKAERLGKGKFKEKK